MGFVNSPGRSVLCFFPSTVVDTGEIKLKRGAHLYLHRANIPVEKKPKPTRSHGNQKRKTEVLGRGVRQRIEACGSLCSPAGLSCGRWLLNSQTGSSFCPHLFAFLCGSLIFSFLSFPKSFFPQWSFIIQPRLIKCHRLVFTRSIHFTFSRQLSGVLALKAYCFYVVDNWILNLSLFCFSFSLENMDYDYFIAFSIRVFPKTCSLKSLCEVICTRGSNCRYSPSALILFF